MGQVGSATYVPSHSVKRACFRFKEMLPEFVWDASFLEGNPFTFPEVKTLLDGVTIGGQKVSDQEQVLILLCHKKLVRFEGMCIRMEILTRGGGVWVWDPVHAAVNHALLPMSRH